MRIIMKANNYIQPIVEVISICATTIICASQNAQLNVGGAATGEGGNEISPELGL